MKKRQILKIINKHGYFRYIGLGISEFICGKWGKNKDIHKFVIKYDLGNY